VNQGIPSDDLPRLVCVSGRTESAVAKILDDLESRPVDSELVRLYHAIHDEDIIGHVVRGYSLLGEFISWLTHSVSPTRLASSQRFFKLYSANMTRVALILWHFS
jgi:hypothetical protein